MELIVLGSGTVAPSADRTAPAHWVTAPAVRLLLDCGAGMVHRAAQFGLPWPDLTHVAITHFHVDHWGELPHLLLALARGCHPPRTAPLPLIGPTGLVQRLERLSGVFGDWVLHPGYPLDVHEVASGDSVELAPDVSLEAFHTPHTDESLAYAIRAGRAGGRRLVYTGDTGRSPELASWAHGCDLLLCECSLPEDRALDIHLTPRQAGELAHSAATRRLVLTHFYPPVDALDPAREARRVFAGPVVAARDGDRFAIGT